MLRSSINTVTPITPYWIHWHISCSCVEKYSWKTVVIWFGFLIAYFGGNLRCPYFFCHKLTHKAGIRMITLRSLCTHSGCYKLWTIMDRWAFVWGCWWIDATCISFQFCPRVDETEYFPFSHQSNKQRWELKKSQNGDTLGPVELIVWPEQGNQGDRRD